MTQKIIGILILGFSILGIVVLVQQETQGPSGSQAQQVQISGGKSEFVEPLDLNIRWRKDFQKLVEQGEIPKAWASIREVRFIPLDKPLAKLVQQLVPPLTTKSDGNYILEVTLMAHVGDDGATYVIFQHNIVDSENDNNIWEINRTYPLIAKTDSTKQ